MAISGTTPAEYDNQVMGYVWYSEGSLNGGDPDFSQLKERLQSSNTDMLIVSSLERLKTVLGNTEIVQLLKDNGVWMIGLNFEGPQHTPKEDRESLAFSDERNAAIQAIRLASEQGFTVMLGTMYGDITTVIIDGEEKVGPIVRGDTIEAMARAGLGGVVFQLQNQLDRDVVPEIAAIIKRFTAVNPNMLFVVQIRPDNWQNEGQKQEFLRILKEVHEQTGAVLIVAVWNMSEIPEQMLLELQSSSEAIQGVRESSGENPSQ
ncbi:hypothetical protein KC686_03905 [Candidatus Woesebacteria bacterium]|nr:hypothetical protein [Candidatus Woesebacteria bacterium]